MFFIAIYQAVEAYHRIRFLPYPRPLDRFAAFLDGLDQESVDARPHDLRQRAARAGDDRGAAGQGFGEYDAERLIPLDRHDHGTCPAQQGVLLHVVHRPDILDAALADLRRDPLPPEPPLRIVPLRVVAGDDQTATGTPRDLTDTRKRADMEAS